MSLQGPGLGEQNQAEGFSQQATSGGEPSNHKGVPVCVITPYVCACTEIIIHTSVKDKRIKNTAHTTRGGGGLKRPCSSLEVQVLSAEAPSNRQWE